MRQIKFRSWISSIQQFVYFENGNYSWIRKTDNVNVFNWDNSQQFTGLLDKNGTDIYEGDVVKMKSYNHSFQDDELCEVFYQEIDARFMFRNNKKFPKDMYTDTTSHHSFEVVGDIYENPELLKEM